MLIYVLTLIGAIVIGLSLGLMGSGGSILTVPVLIYGLGQDEKLAIASSLAIVGLISAIGSIPYIKQHLVHWRTVVLFGIPGMIGTYSGAHLSTYVSGVLQLSVFALVMLVASFLMLKPPAVEAEVSAGSRSVFKIGIEGFIVGNLTGFVGVGGGFLIVPALVLLGGLSMHQGIATSLVIIALKSATGFIKYIDILKAEHISIDVKTILIISVVGIIGSLAGNLISKRLPQQTLQRYFGIFLIAMGCYILWKSAPQLLQ